MYLRLSLADNNKNYFVIERISPNKVIRLLGNPDVEYRSIRMTASESGKDKFILCIFPDNHYLIT